MKTHECGATKTCNVCGQERSLSEYKSRIGRLKNGGESIWYEGKCKACMKKHAKAYRDKNLQMYRDISRKSYQRTRKASLKRKKAYYEANKDKYSHWRKQNADDNREREREKGRAWRKRNLATDAAKVRRRYAAKKNAVPAWADSKKINLIYKLSEEMTVKTGIKHHVDHIYPLKGKLVSGLHCEDNLRVITAVENVRKSNKLVDDVC